jgi:hypothetical protein
MLRWLRILIAMVVVAAAATAVRAFLDFQGELGEALNLGLMIGGLFLVSLSDRELFWAASPSGRGARRRSRPIN